MSNRNPRSNRLFTVDEIYRQLVGPGTHPAEQGEADKPKVDGEE